MNDTIRGSLLMAFAMGAFAIEDMLVKTASAGLPMGEVLILFGLGGMALFALITCAQGQPLWHPGLATRPMLLRGVSEVSGRLLFTLAIVLTPLSLASAILQATPLVVTAGSVVFFGELVGWRRWLAIAFGFAGVLMILRPGMSGVPVTSLLAVGGMLGFAGRDLATRAAPRDMSNAQLGIFGFAMLALAGIVALSWSGGARRPQPLQWLALGGTICVGVLAYLALTAAMRTGEISVVAPFRYTRLVFAMILGILVFGERPDLLTLLGSVVVVSSGVFTLLRSKKRTAVPVEKAT